MGVGVNIPTLSPYPFSLHLSHTIPIYTYIWICLSHIDYLFVTLYLFPLPYLPITLLVLSTLSPYLFSLPVSSTGGTICSPLKYNVSIGTPFSSCNMIKVVYCGRHELSSNVILSNNNVLIPRLRIYSLDFPYLIPLPVLPYNVGYNIFLHSL